MDTRPDSSSGSRWEPSPDTDSDTDDGTDNDPTDPTDPTAGEGDT